MNGAITDLLERVNTLPAYKADGIETVLVELLEDQYVSLAEDMPVDAEEKLPSSGLLYIIDRRLAWRLTRQYKPCWNCKETLTIYFDGGHKRHNYCVGRRW